MYRKFLPLFILLACFFLKPSAQLSGWSYKTVVSPMETSGVTRSNFQVRYVFDSQTLIGNGKLQANGGDLRFADVCGTIFYPYWIESGLNTAQTVVWVKVPVIPANSTISLYMFYGNNAAPDGNNFAATFPGAIRTNGSNLTLTGALTADFVWVEANDTIFTTAGASLSLSGLRKLRIDATGQINGVGRGFQGPAINTIGTGPGGGGTSTNSGCGGGSYAGVGGTGGLDAGDTPGTGGAAYGTAAGTDCQLGSSGGSGTGISTGGNGGGALDVNAEYVEINGSIAMNGRTAAVDGTGRGGGGGAGGCILITCAEATGTGSLSATGGNGGFGTSTANDSGGGGGGGRIKSFSQAAWPGTLTQTVTGGIGGPNGTAAPGQPGGAGSTSNLVQAYSPVNPTIFVGSEMTTTATGEITSTATAVCIGASLVLDATPGFASYAWSTGGSNASTTVSASGTYSVVLTDSAGCSFSDTIVLGSVAPMPINITGQGVVCGGSCDTLSADLGYSNYLWSTGDTNSVILACASGAYTVQAIDTGGCTVMDTLVVTILPTIVVGNGIPITACDGAITLLDASGNFVAWIWSTGDTMPMITVTTSGSYSVTVTDANGCEGNGTFTVNYLPAPTPSLVQNGNLLSVTPSYPAYQWLLNGSPILGETASTYTVTATGIYSVQVTDANGCVGTSDTASVVVGVRNALALGAMIYPNPASESTTVIVNLDAAEILQVRVLDALGKVVAQREMQGAAGQNRLDLNVAAFAAGVYQIHLSNGSAQQVLKFVKQ
jgi:Domain of unknown function (DUF2341)/Secretion system C-terminal sorting domain